MKKVVISNNLNMKKEKKLEMGLFKICFRISLLSKNLVVIINVLINNYMKQEKICSKT